MENPVYWGVLEHTISRALTEALEARERGLVGASMEMTIAVALRGAGLIDVTHDHTPTALGSQLVCKLCSQEDWPCAAVRAASNE